MRFLLLAACSIIASVPAPPFDADCTGIGVTAEIALICSGTCPAGGNCASRGDGLDDRGEFSYCGCFQHDYDTCCTVVLRHGVPRKYGTCAQCGASGQCKALDNPDGELREPTCVQIVYPPRPILK